MIDKQLIETISNLELLSFYGWWQFGVCLFAFVGLLTIWYHIGKKQKDFGQVWLAISVLCWSFSGLIEVYFTQLELKQWIDYIEMINSNGLSPSAVQSFKQEIVDNQNLLSIQWNGWRSIFSLSNSLFILLALPWFRYIPTSIGALIKSKFWIYIVGLPFAFSLLPTIRKMWNQTENSLINELDVYYAVLTLVFLAVVMWSSFAKRRLPILAWLSFVCILITFIAQIYKMLDSDIDLILFSAIFKTSLIMIFFALALSWVKELSENTITNLQKLGLRMFNNSTAKIANKGVILSLASKKYTIELSDSYYNLMSTFINKKSAGKPDESWLEIKPKNSRRGEKTYDIQDHNQVKRLLNQILDTIYGKNNWSNDIHGVSLKEKLFEKSSQSPRLIRLAEDVEIS